MKILLTGATGGIGSAIKARLQEHDLTCIAHSDTKTEESFDWLICAHGILDESDLLGTFVANTLSSIHLAQTVKAKNIIFISSTAGINGNTSYPIYAASKAALNIYCKSIPNCYALCPGPTDTPLIKHLDIQKQSPTKVAKAVEHIMLGKYKSGDVITIRDGHESLS